jgi:hypothetical protein
VTIEKLWWQERPKNAREAEKLIEDIERQLELDALIEFERKYGLTESIELEKNLKIRLEQLRKEFP